MTEVHLICDRIAKCVASHFNSSSCLDAAPDIECDALALRTVWSAAALIHREPLPLIELADGFCRVVVPRLNDAVPILTATAPRGRPLALLRQVRSRQLTPGALATMLRLLATVACHAPTYLSVLIDLAQGERTPTTPAQLAHHGKRAESMRWGNGVWLLERTLARRAFSFASARPAYLSSADGVRSMKVRAMPAPSNVYDHREGYQWIVPSHRPLDPPRAVNGARVHAIPRRHDRARYHRLSHELAHLQGCNRGDTARAQTVAAQRNELRQRILLPPEVADAIH